MRTSWRRRYGFARDSTLYKKPDSGFRLRREKDWTAYCGPDTGLHDWFAYAKPHLAAGFQLQTRQKLHRTVLCSYILKYMSMLFLVGRMRGGMGLVFGVSAGR